MKKFDESDRNYIEYLFWRMRVWIAALYNYDQGVATIKEEHRGDPKKLKLATLDLLGIDDAAERRKAIEYINAEFKKIVIKEANNPNYIDSTFSVFDDIAFPPS